MDDDEEEEEDDDEEEDDEDGRPKKRLKRQSRIERIESLEATLLGPATATPIGMVPRLANLEKHAYGMAGMVTDCRTGVEERLIKLENDFRE